MLCKKCGRWFLRNGIKKYCSLECAYSSKDRNNKLGKHFLKDRGKSYEEIYGEEKGKWMRDIRKNNINCKGKKASSETKILLSILHSGENNPMYGIRLCGEKNGNWKGGLNKCIICDKQIGRGRTWCRQHQGESIRGQNNHNWNNGSSFLPYCSKFNKDLKEEVRNRDGRICQLCGKNEKENIQKLPIHHIHYDKENCFPDLISLCFSCNSRVNYNRRYWEEYFMNKLNKRSLLFWTREHV